MRRGSRAMLVTALVAGLAAPAAAGYQIVNEDGETALVSKGRYKSVPKQANAPVFVFDVNRGRLWMANPGIRQYWEGTIEEFCKEFPAAMEQAFAGMGKQMEQQRQAELAKLPPAARAKREKEEAETKRRLDAMNTPEGQARMKREMEEWAKKMGGDPKSLDEPQAAPAAPKVSVQRTNDREKIAGIEARRYQVTVEVDGERYYEDNWLATDPAFLREIAYDKFSAAQARFERCMESANGTKDEGEIDIEKTREYVEMRSQGFPLKVVARQEGDQEGEPKEEVTAVESRDVPDAEFAPPAGFKKTSLSEMTRAQMGQPAGK